MKAGEPGDPARRQCADGQRHQDRFDRPVQPCERLSCRGSRTAHSISLRRDQLPA
jgi:hypothetical protein